MNLKKSFFLTFILFSILRISQGQPDAEDPDPQRFQEEIDLFREWDTKNSFQEHSILFVGSSSIRFWKSHEAFPDYPVINRGFGGSHISDVQHYYDRLIGKYHPSVIVFYAGDNDIADGKPVRQVVGDYKELTNRILQDFPEVKFIYVPIKPSSSRWSFWEKMKQTNRQINDYSKKNDHLYYVNLATPLLGPEGKPDDLLFRDDRLHLNEKGYEVWNRHLGPELEALFDH